MKNSILFLFFASLINLQAQEAPEVRLNDSTRLKLSVLSVDVQIIGNFATTTYDMKFYNELDRTLEGELAFPLGQGQSVSGFAMDVNGKMRDAVIVEKELARVAFESTVRKNIDPGLLEKTQGNNYKARIYPILPKDYKRIRVTYEQELFLTNDVKVYELPLGFKENLDEFSIDIKVYGKNNPLGVNSMLNFNQNDDSFQASLFKENYTPSNPIIVHIPDTLGSKQVLNYNNFFYVNQRLKPNSKIKKKPNKITVLWDASFSLAHKKYEKELELLNLYFTYLQNVEVEFISFNNSINNHKRFIITDGAWLDLKREIESIRHDGGTSLSFLNALKLKSDEVILFTDGLANLGDYNLSAKKTMYVVNSSGSGNHELMNAMATTSGGSYINLTRYTSIDALEILKHETFQFLGIKNNKDVEEIYPNTNTNVISDFSVTGKFSKNTVLTLLFGYQNKVEKKVKVFVNNSTSNEKIVKRLWAKQKLRSLNKNKKENKKKIISLAKKYNLITDYTSLLILDRIEDYVKYRIEPPQELRSEYKERIANIEEEELYKQEEIQERREELFEDYEDLIEWYTTKFPKKKNKKPIKPNVRTSSNNINQNPVQNTGVDTSQITDNTNDVIERSNTTVEANVTVIDSTRRIVSGVVTDEKGLPLPGVNIVVKGTSTGTQTDFDGNFVINTDVGQELDFSYIGFVSANITINNSNTINVVLKESASMLEEVVVTGYAAQKKSFITASVATVQSESFSEALAGVVSGVTVSGQSGASSKVEIRGVSTISNNSQPLYIVDGIPVEGNPTSQLSPDQIESLQILKDTSASAIYGSRGANGVIVITTKEGKKSNKDAIAKLNQEITDKIQLKAWNPDTPYIKTLEKEKTVDLAYMKYLEIRKKYTNIPSFYLDVADFFDKKDAQDIAIRVLTNLMEVDLDNHELMKALAYKLEYFDKYDSAVIVYEKMLELRPEEPQSYRDLAIAYEHIGEVQKSFDLLYKI
ncbi:VIT domain-containing protein [Aquimarina sp. MMG016]|uniref:VIT domain-containing protein n=1 Tax=Aquimarina sp. MMG016 TaxID=2822690 RepID=UPI001B3A57EB|nr:VIT domain-containing protein [Aquimarina sp. MMG016]MBQ4822290.1 carboxypeptidase-like regulatory domain-containing protein [Aquimarina sp. MMG016]